MIAVVDYGAGNLQSVKKALDFIGADSEISADASFIASADGVILPGVGSFEDAMDSMRSRCLVEAVTLAAESAKSGGAPFLGICLGLQLLFESSQESPGVSGLGVLGGEILRIPSVGGLKVPHMGWNSLEICKSDEVFSPAGQNAYVYFVHSYYLRASDLSDVAARTGYGVTIDAAVSHGRLFAAQFHPEKSGSVGLDMLRRFNSLCERSVD